MNKWKKFFGTIIVVTLCIGLGVGLVFGISAALTVPYDASDAPVTAEEASMETTYYVLPSGEGLTCIEELRTRRPGGGCAVTATPHRLAVPLEESSWSLSYITAEDGTSFACLAWGATRTPGSCFPYEK